MFVLNSAHKRGAGRLIGKVDNFANYAMFTAPKQSAQKLTTLELWNFATLPLACYDWDLWS
jgi:hypothetical protein